MALLKLAVQYVSSDSNLPKLSEFRQWAKATINVDTEVTIRLVDEEEGRHLNKTYRGKDYATNVLTFPLTEAPHLIGDIVICSSVVKSEAVGQNKPLEAHYAHLTVHGLLHLQGYDHEIEAQAELMESIETAIITKLGYANPYLIT
ncbi:COG0319 Predicted metal-dependent hydrolase [Methylophilaceae bacterium]|jgi:probable rRNA maturation factor